MKIHMNFYETLLLGPQICYRPCFWMTAAKQCEPSEYLDGRLWEKSCTGGPVGDSLPSGPNKNSQCSSSVMGKLCCRRSHPSDEILYWGPDSRWSHYIYLGVYLVPFCPLSTGERRTLSQIQDLRHLTALRISSMTTTVWLSVERCLTPRDHLQPAT